ncbi:hypothetical protein ACFL6S_27770 [Candidatus Poribacteria bacterium]
MSISSSHNGKAPGWIIALCFILVIGSVPLIQFIKEISSGEQLQEFDLFKRTPTVANLRSYESEIEDNSVVAEAARPWYQLLSTRLARQGNAEAVMGRDGWLFHRPGVDFVISPGSNFHRELGPLPAIIAFQETLKAQGVDLLILPVPDKASIYPEDLSARYDIGLGPAVNPYTSDFFRLLRENGVQIFDPADLLWKEKGAQASDGRSAELLYIPQDTHWSPRGMKLVAQSLAEVIRTGGWISGAPEKMYDIQPVEVTRFGDIYEMLNLPEKGRAFEPLGITMEEVLDAQTGSPCAPSSDSPIVLLGDSFVNVFSEAEMDWGKHGGLGEHLALQLGIPIDVIAINDGGATTSRESLARRTNALVGKKLVIWQFPTRDLVNPESEWKIVDIPKPQMEMETASRQLVVVAEVTKPSRVPNPIDVAYTECVTYIKYRVLNVEQGEYQDDVLIAVFWGMKDSKLMPAAGYQTGQKHRLSLEPFEDHEELSHIMQADDTDDYEHIPFWVIEVSSR